ncbi:hypothetical protein AN958_04454 [Leucoagaricus sp. SymC.cos]|nr:hypothetical protein AN958_04454 [Leucoagaricus sp. SymC.cos]
MMALSLADSAEIMSAYDAVLNNNLNWFLLHYSNKTVDELALYAFGSEGLEELKTKIGPSDNEQTLVGFLRVDADDLPLKLSSPIDTREDDGLEYDEGGGGGIGRGTAAGEDEEEGGEAKYLLVSYVPKGVLGVRRARAQVHTRRLGMIFKRHDAVLTIDDISQLTVGALAQSLAEPDSSLLTFSSAAAGQVVNSLSSPVSLPLSPNVSRKLVTGSLLTPLDTTTTTAGSVVYSTPPHPIHAHNRTSPVNSPPISPTTHYPELQSQQYPYPHHEYTAPDMGRSFSQPIPTHASPFATTSTAQGVGYGTTPGGVAAAPIQDRSNYIDLKPVKRSASESSPVGGYGQGHNKHNSSSGGGSMRIGSQISNFLRRGKKRSGSDMGRGVTSAGGGGGGRGYGMGDVDESQESEDSMPPPTPPKDKGVYTPARKQAGYEEEHRHHGGHVTQYPDDFQTHAHHTHLASRTSFRHTHSVSEFALISHEGVMGDDGGRTETDVENDIVIIRPEEFGLYGIQAEKPLPAPGQHHQQKPSYGIHTLKKGKWAEPQGLSAIRDPVERDVKAKAREGTMTGWVTIQTDESVVWRRRYFKFSPNTFYFYRSPKDLTHMVDRLDVRGTVKALKEPEDGYEDLKAIPHSFAIEFHDRAPWAMFVDSEEEKFKMLGLLQYGAGL